MTESKPVLTGLEAIEYAEANGVHLNKYEDPTEGARSLLSVADAREIARADASLIWVEAGTDHGRHNDVCPGAPGSTDEDTASGDSPCLVSGTGVAKNWTDLFDSLSNWIDSTFDAIPTEVVVSLHGTIDGESGISRYEPECEECDGRGEVEGEDGQYTACPHCNGSGLAVTPTEMLKAYPAAWKTMWHPRRLLDPDMLVQCGFQVYNTASFGMLIGIDGAGYDFHEKHWAPLRRALVNELTETIERLRTEG